MSASVASTPPCTVPRMLQCLRSARRPIASEAPSPREYSGPTSSMYGLVRKSGLKPSGTKQRDEVVFADALQYQEGDRGAAAVRHEMRPPRRHAVGLARGEAHFLLRLLQEDAQRALEHVEGIGDVAMGVPGNLLRGGELQLGDAKARPRRVLGATLDFVEGACVLDCFHRRLPRAVKAIA